MEPTGIVIGVKEVVGLIMAAGLGLGGLVKSGHLRVGKSNGASASTPSSFDLVDCEKKHDKLDETIVAWDNMAQTILLEQNTTKSTLKVHREKLEEGTLKMNQLDDKVGEIGKGVAVLLDRTKEG